MHGDTHKRPGTWQRASKRQSEIFHNLVEFKKQSQTHGSGPASNTRKGLPLINLPDSEAVGLGGYRDVMVKGSRREGAAGCVISLCTIPRLVGIKVKF